MRFLPVVDQGAVVRFETSGSDAATHVHAVVGFAGKRDVRRANVTLPLSASGAVKLEDSSSKIAVAFSLDGMLDVKLAVTRGIAVYAKAYGEQADVVHRVHEEGTEDYVFFAERPARPELSYRVEVSRVAGLRLVSNTLEFLDDSGTPMLRVAPPYVVDSKGERHEARLAVNGCAYDTSPAAPWGRRVTKPGAERCSVRVTWAGDVCYPAMVDPAWTTTGSMATARGYGHTVSVLPSGRVLVAGGDGGTTLASAEIYDAAGNAGAGTFAATGSMTTARDNHMATVLASGKVLLTGGYFGGQSLASAEIYDAGAGTFTATGSMGAKREGHTAVVLSSGKVLVAGGIGSTILASAEVFDAAGNAGAGAFAATGDLATARQGHTAIVLPSGKVLVAGGHDGAGCTASAEVFDAAGNAGAGIFTATAPMGAARGCPACC